MSPCDKTRFALDEYTLGLSSLDDLDTGHIRSCAECQERYVEATRLRTLLSDYADSVDEFDYSGLE